MGYHDFTNSVFSEPSEYRIPPHRPNIDYEMNLTDETKLIFGPIYNLSENKLKILEKYIENYVGKRFIQLSILSFRSLVLFTKRPNGSLYLCIDY